MSDAGFYYAPDPSSQGSPFAGVHHRRQRGGELRRPAHPQVRLVTTNHVLGLEVVLPTGDDLGLNLVHFGGAVADTPGYDLTGLFVGSEGTFGHAIAPWARSRVN